MPVRRAGLLTLCLLQATLFDPQLHDGSCVCERVASIVDGEQSGVGTDRAGWGHREGKTRLSSARVWR